MVYIAIIMLLGIVIVSRLASYIAIMHKYIHIAQMIVKDMLFSYIYVCKRQVFAMCSYVGS